VLGAHGWLPAPRSENQLFRNRNWKTTAQAAETKPPAPCALYGEPAGRDSLSAVRFVRLGGGTRHRTQRDAVGRACLAVADGLTGGGDAAAAPHDG
jgi:hypothetical protein